MLRDTANTICITDLFVIEGSKSADQVMNAKVLITDFIVEHINLPMAIADSFEQLFKKAFPAKQLNVEQQKPFVLSMMHWLLIFLQQTVEAMKTVQIIYTFYRWQQ